MGKCPLILYYEHFDLTYIIISNLRFGSLESDVDIVALAKDGVGTAHQRLISIRKMLRNRFRDDDIQSNSNFINFSFRSRKSVLGYFECGKYQYSSELVSLFLRFH